MEAASNLMATSFGLSSVFGLSAIALLHHFAQTIRRIDKGTLAQSEDEHFEYIDDRVNPQFIKL
jgi:hypothetical protein